MTHKLNCFKDFTTQILKNTAYILKNVLKSLNIRIFLEGNPVCNIFYTVQFQNYLGPGAIPPLNNFYSIQNLNQKWSLLLYSCILEKKKSFTPLGSKKLSPDFHLILCMAVLTCNPLILFMR